MRQDRQLWLRALEPVWGACVLLELLHRDVEAGRGGSRVSWPVAWAPVMRPGPGAGAGAMCLCQVSLPADCRARRDFARSLFALSYLPSQAPAVQIFVDMSLAGTAYCPAPTRVRTHALQGSAGMHARGGAACARGTQILQPQQSVVLLLAVERMVSD